MIDDAERWNRVKQVFQDALEQPAAERGLFLRGACGDDRELRGEVESLLLAHAAAGSFAQGPAVEALPPSGAVALRDGEWAEHRLQRGARLGQYEILSAIGKGGMGEVYRARDSKLGRDVAIKILPRIFTSDPDRLARFEREARLLASLNHPNIGAIYGLEDVDGIPALVLELVEGDTLAERLVRGGAASGSPKRRDPRPAGLPLGEALTIARQIADALEAAHEQGIVHRDLKPANIKITSAGRREGARLRPREIWGRPSKCCRWGWCARPHEFADDDERHGRRRDPWDGRLHEPRAGARKGCRRTLGYLGVRRRPVRDADWQIGIRRRHGGRRY